MLDGDLLRVFHQALARLNFVTEVTEDHVREAVRLVEASKVRHAGTRQRTRPRDHAGGNKREGTRGRGACFGGHSLEQDWTACA